MVHRFACTALVTSLLHPALHAGEKSAAEASAAVLFFTTIDCPIANSYAPEIARIAVDYGSRGVRFTLVYVDPDLSRAEIIAHAKDYGLSEIPVLVDRKHLLVKRAGATRTPEVALYDAGGKLAYLGRIDNCWAGFGDKRNAPTATDLRDALDALLAGHPVANEYREAIGCSIPELEQ
ncbi:MAG: redoxin family protein [Verrucomicrobiales bacterium]